jgi:hypothetical protein
MKRFFVFVLWVTVTVGFAGAGFVVTRTVTAKDTLGRARLALIDRGVDNATATIDGSSLVVGGVVMTPPEHVAAIVAVRRHYPSRHIVDNIQVLRAPTNAETQAMLTPDAFDPVSAAPALAPSGDGSSGTQPAPPESLSLGP